MSLLTPNVIVDFELVNELFFIRIANHSDVEVKDLRIRFHKNIYGLHKKEKINRLRIFNNISYLAPRKEIRLVVDHMDTFFHYNKNPIYRVRIEHRDISGKSMRKEIIHDLNIYRDLPQIFNSNSSRNSVLDNLT